MLRRSGHELDVPKLQAYLRDALPEDDVSALSVEQFSHGQSNPTYVLTTARGSKLVLRKQPPGKLLRGAHDVSREYRVMKCLQGIAPVPRVRLLCTDPNVVGTDFVVYDYAEGRHFGDVRMPELEPKDRTAIMISLLRTLGR